MKPSVQPVLHIEEKPGAEVLIVAFTGIAAKFNAINPFDFFKLTGLLRYHRILVRDPWCRCYLKGIDETGLEGLVERLRNEIERLAPKRILFMGVSSGGYAALLFGHLLKPDYVHAFSPRTYLDYVNMLKAGGYRHSVLSWPLIMIRINLLPAHLRRYLDLRPLLMTHNGKTRFYIHTCAGNFDRARAEHVKDCPHTKIFLYPGRSHNVTWGMLKNKYLFELLRVENLDDIEAIYHRFYADFDPDNPNHDVSHRALKNELASILKK